VSDDSQPSGYRRLYRAELAPRRHTSHFAHATRAKAKDPYGRAGVGSTNALFTPSRLAGTLQAEPSKIQTRQGPRPPIPFPSAPPWLEQAVFNQVLSVYSSNPVPSNADGDILSAGLPAPRKGGIRHLVLTPVLGFEPRSEAPQASRIIHCSGFGIASESRSYPTRAPKKGPLFGGRRGGPRIKARGRATAAPTHPL
jgi:hypothetical protein